MHLIRDCVNAKEKWKGILAEEHWDRFFNLEGPDWLAWNLKKEAGVAYTKRVAWPTLFGYLCWDIWTSRCKRVFDADYDDSQRNHTDTFLRAGWDKDLLASCKFYGHDSRQSSTRQNQQTDFVQLETDGSVLHTGSIAVVA